MREREDERDFFLHPRSARLTFRPARSTQFSASPGFIKSLSSSHSERGPFRYFVVGLFLFRFLSRADLFHIAVFGLFAVSPSAFAPDIPLGEKRSKGVTRKVGTGSLSVPRCPTKVGGREREHATTLFRGEAALSRTAFHAVIYPTFLPNPPRASELENVAKAEGDPRMDRVSKKKQQQDSCLLPYDQVRLNFAPGSHGDLEERPSRCDSVMRTRLKIK